MAEREQRQQQKQQQQQQSADNGGEEAAAAGDAQSEVSYSEDDESLPEGIDERNDARMNAL